MNAPEFSPCRSKLRRISDSPFSCPAALPSFFERLIEEADGAGLGGDGCGAEVRLGASGPLPGEREEDFEMRRRDFATEMGISFDRWPYSLEDKFAAGDALFREKQYKQVGAATRKAESIKNKSKIKTKMPFYVLVQAYHEFTDALFACMAHPFVKDVVHFSETVETDEEEEEEDRAEGEDCGGSEETEDALETARVLEAEGGGGGGGSPRQRTRRRRRVPISQV